ncbi:MAG: hypothetical protein WB424_12920, partial [Terracidiphilus sp.]
DGFALFQTADEDAVMKRCKRGCCCHCCASPSQAVGVDPRREIGVSVKNNPSNKSSDPCQ